MNVYTMPKSLSRLNKDFIITYFFNYLPYINNVLECFSVLNSSNTILKDF